jgi:23S rRNA (uridine2552-2'-O)-methyltransferase
MHRKPTRMAYNRKDHFYKRAKKEGKASRAFYKLSQIQSRFKLIRRDEKVLDLGCAPGGWLQELSQIVGKSGRVIGIDLLPVSIALPSNVVVIHGDLNDDESLARVEHEAGGLVDVVLSDMSPNLSGIAFADAYRSYELSMLAFEVCEKSLREGGNFVTKIFPGEEFEGYVKTLKQNFTKVTTVTPEATRKTSSERYLVAMGFKKK